MIKRNRNSRRELLKSIPLAVLSFGAFSLFKNRKENPEDDLPVNRISRDEANAILRQGRSPGVLPARPMPSPERDRSVPA